MIDHEHVGHTRVPAGQADGIHLHVQAPPNPIDGSAFACPCGVAYEYVVLEDGYAEWVQAGEG